MYVCTCMYLCMCVCMYVCTCMYVCMSMYVCMYMYCMCMYIHVHVCTCMYVCMYKCMYVCIYYTYSIFSIHIATSFNNRPFSGNVGVSAYSGADRLLLIGESIVVTAHGMLHVHVLYCKE